MCSNIQDSSKRWELKKKRKKKKKKTAGFRDIGTKTVTRVSFANHCYVQNDHIKCAKSETARIMLLPWLCYPAIIMCALAHALSLMKIMCQLKFALVLWTLRWKTEIKSNEQINNGNETKAQNYTKKLATTQILFELVIWLKSLQHLAKQCNNYHTNYHKQILFGTN